MEYFYWFYPLLKSAEPICTFEKWLEIQIRFPFFVISQHSFVFFCYYNLDKGN